ASLRRRYPFITEGMARHFARTYGSSTETLLDGATRLEDLGENFGHDFYEAELRYLVQNEWVRELDDAIWRRTKQGMWLNEAQQARVAEWLATHSQKPSLSLAS
ncbi:glycerol-3-phosphate dehydrogenase C-terminal domain-containing protein, partial [Pantoea septica]